METGMAESTIMPNTHLMIPSSPLTFRKSSDVARCFIRFSILASLLPKPPTPSPRGRPSANETGMELCLSPLLV